MDRRTFMMAAAVATMPLPASVAQASETQDERIERLKVDLRAALAEKWGDCAFFGGGEGLDTWVFIRSARKT